MKFIRENTISGVLVAMALCGSFYIAVVDEKQRTPFLTIAVTAIGAWFGAQTPGGTSIRRVETEEHGEETNTTLRTTTITEKPLDAPDKQGNRPN